MSRRRLGQHFLTDLGTISRIVGAAELSDNDHVFEIGPGRGAITFPLVRAASRVTSLELDPELADALEMDPSEGFQLVRGDALTADFAALQTTSDRARSVLVANLPYRITGALLERILEAGCWDRAVLMVQREVGRRLAASVGDKDYGILTIAANLRSEVEYLFSVDADCFYPSPKVVSSVVRLRFRPHPTGVEDEALFFRVVRTAFQQRRKMLRNSLAGVLHERVEEVLASAGVDPAARPESVSVEGFERVCRAYAL